MWKSFSLQVHDCCIAFVTWGHVLSGSKITGDILVQKKVSAVLIYQSNKPITHWNTVQLQFIQAPAFCNKEFSMNFIKHWEEYFPLLILFHLEFWRISLILPSFLSTVHKIKTKLLKTDFLCVDQEEKDKCLNDYDF